MAVTLGLGLLIALPLGVRAKISRSVPQLAPLSVAEPHLLADPVTASLVDQALAASTDEEALELLTRASTREGFARRHPTTWDASVPNYVRLNELRAALRFRAFDDESADPKAAAETLLVALRLGRLLKDGDSTVFDFMAGVSLMEPDALHALALQTSVPND